MGGMKPQEKLGGRRYPIKYKRGNNPSKHQRQILLPYPVARPHYFGCPSSQKDSFNLTLFMRNASPVCALEGISKRVLLVEISKLQVCGGSNITPSDSDVRILGHHAYIFIEWDMHIISFTGIGVPSMEYIPVHVIMEKLQCLVLYAIGMG